MNKKIIISLIAISQFTFNVNAILAQEKVDSTIKPTFNQTISTEKYKKGGVIDPFLLFTGEATGVSLNKKGSNPNVFNTALIRGISSNYSPGVLYIIDGVYGANPSLILPDEIESMEVLKDVASTAKYGSQGFSGVIIIKTKSCNEEKKISINFNSFLSLNTPAKKLDLLSAKEYRTLAKNYNDPDFIDGGSTTDWQDEIFRNTVTQTYDLAVSGKLNNTGYRVSIFRQDNPGIVMGSEMENTGINMRLTQNAIQNRLKINASASIVNPKRNITPSYSSGNDDNIFYQTFMHNPTDPVYNPDGTFNQSHRDFNYFNPMPIIKYTKNTSNAKNYNINLAADYTIINGLNFNINLGYLLYNNDSEYNQSSNAFSGYKDEASSISTYDNRSFNIETGLTYCKDFGEDHKLSINVGYANRNWEDKSFNHYTSTGLDLKISNKENRYLNSIVGQVEYSFKQRYFLSALVTKESSKYKPGENYSNQIASSVKHNNMYPAFTAGWKLKNEPFMKNIGFINDLTVKGSYGIIGNVQGDFLKYQLFLIGFECFKTEKMEEFSLGLDFGLWKNRLSGSINYYERNAKNAIAPIILPAPPFPIDLTQDNGAWFKNKGIEVTINAQPVEKKNFRWISSLSFFSNKNELVSNRTMPSNGLSTGYFSNGSIVFSTQLIKPGNPITVFYLPEMVGHTSTGYPIFKMEDGTFTSNYSLAKKKIISQSIPKYEIGWANSFQLPKGFDISFSLKYAGGYSIYNATRMHLSNIYNFPYLNISHEGAENYSKGYRTAPLNDIYLEDASYLRLENLTISYTLKPKKIFWGNSMNFYLSANNLFTITKFTGLDPAGYSDGVDFFNVYPLARSYVFGIRLML